MKEKSTLPAPRPSVITVPCIHCLKELSNRVIPWMFPEWVCDHLWHTPHSVFGRRSYWCFESSYKKQSSVYYIISIQADYLLSMETLSLISHNSPVISSWVRPLCTEPPTGFIFSIIIYLRRRSTAVLFGDCSSMMPRCFRTMLWCLVTPTTAETSPEVKLWSKSKLWRNFYLICIPLFHLHIHPAQSASLLATSTC